MFSRLFARVLGISTGTLQFISENPRRMRVRMLIVIPIVGWGALLYQINPLFLKWLVDSLTQNWRDFGIIQLNSVLPLFVTIVIGYLIIQLIDGLLRFTKSSLLYSFDRRAEEDLEERFKLFAEKFEDSFLVGHNNMRLLRNLQLDSRYIRQKFSSLQSILIEIPVAIIALLSILPLLHPVILVLIIVSAIASLYVQYSQSNAWRKTEFLEGRYAIESSDVLHQMYTKISVLVANGWLDQFFALYKRRRMRWNTVRNHQNTQDKLFDLINSIINSFTTAATTIVGGVLAISGVITIGTFTVLGLYVDRVKSLITNIGELLRLIIELRYVLTRLDYLLKIEPKLSLSRNSTYNITTINSISIENIVYSYPQISHEEYGYLKAIQLRFGLDKQKHQRFSIATIKSILTTTYLTPSQRRLLKEEFREIDLRLNSNTEKPQIILNKLTYTFQRGYIYQLNGEAGSGKTTLINLLKHSLEPDEGKIIIDFKDIKQINTIKILPEIPIQDWKKTIGSVIYDTSFWPSFSLREILSFGIPNPDSIKSSKMIEALSYVGLNVKENELDLVMSESIDFSSGKRILIQFARLLLCHKALIIIDESIIHIKGSHEDTINQLVQRLKKQSIIIIESSVIPERLKIDEIIDLPKPPA